MTHVRKRLDLSAPIDTAMKVRLRARFARNVRIDAATGCHEWTKRLGRSGYPRTSINECGVVAHRLAFAVFKGPIPQGLHIRHSCDNRACIAPDNLLLGTVRDNAIDRETRNRGRWRSHISPTPRGIFKPHEERA